MLDLRLLSGGRRALKVLCLGAHCDDIEIGCGGTLLQLQRRNPAVEVMWVAFSSDATRARELRTSARRFLKDTSRSHVETLDFPDAQFPACYSQLKKAMSGVRSGFVPDVIFTHYRDDRHQDHRVISELTWGAFRNHLILEYEIPKYDGGLDPPNAFVELERSIAARKVRFLLGSYRTQSARSWFTEDTFRGLMRIRGIESAAGSGFAEAFHARKLCLA